MKKIKVLTSFYYNDYPYQAGQIYDLDDDIADKLEIEKRLIIISTLTNTEIEKARRWCMKLLLNVALTPQLSLL